MNESELQQPEQADEDRPLAPDLRGLGRIDGGWQAYEEMKRAWIRRNPNATPRQYEQAMRRITQRLGI